MILTPPAAKGRPSVRCCSTEPYLRNHQMSRKIILAVSFAACLVSPFICARPAAAYGIDVTSPDRVSWSTTSFRGVSIAVAARDPMGGGTYAVFVKFPPHTGASMNAHPDQRIITVLSGTVYFVVPDRQTSLLKAGPAEADGLVWTYDDEAILQVGTAPTATKVAPFP